MSTAGTSKLEVCSNSRNNPFPASAWMLLLKCYHISNFICVLVHRSPHYYRLLQLCIHQLVYFCSADCIIKDSHIIHIAFKIWICSILALAKIVSCSCCISYLSIHWYHCYYFTIHI